MIWYDMIWYDMIWYDMIWNEMKWNEMKWNEMIWYDMIWYDMIWFYLHKIAAQRLNYNVQYKTRREKTVWSETKLKVQQQTTKKQGQTVKQASKEENRKQEV